MIVAAIVGLVTGATSAVAEEPAKPTKLKSLGAIASSDEFTGSVLAWEDKGNTAVCYGTLKLAGKPRYTYFVLFKVDPGKTERGHDVTTKKSAAFGADGGTLPMVVMIAEAKFEFTYKFEANQKAGTIRESIAIGDKDYDKDVPRVFLVDLTQDKITCRPVKDARPEPVGDLDRVAEAIHQLKEKNAEVKEFFQGKAK
jgi:hypothetical protein